MVIEESVVIRATPDKVWQTFVDITCWNDWNTVLKNVSPAGTGSLGEGEVTFCIYPFAFPIYFTPVIEEISPGRKVVWKTDKFGVSARHEFIFRETGEGVSVTSREKFRVLGLEALRFFLPEFRLRELTVSFLDQLKKAAEK